MVTGIVGVLFSFFAMGFLPAVAAVVMGHMAQKKQPYARGYWVTGLITGYVGIGISLVAGLFIAASILLPLFFIGSAGYFSEY